MTEPDCTAQTPEWAARLAQPIEIRQAIQDKVHAAFQSGSVQGGRDMAKAIGMPTSPAAPVISVAAVEAERELEDDLWAPVSRLDD